MNLSLADFFCAYNISKIGIALTKDSLISPYGFAVASNQVQFPSLDTNQLFFIPGTGAVSYTEWTEVCRDITLEFDANYLTIGTFRKYRDITDIVYSHGDSLFGPSTYYYIDDVSVICTKESGCDDVGVETILEQVTLQVFPNPFSEQLTVVLPTKQASTLVIYDLTGRAVLTQTTAAANEIQVSTGGLAPGIYIVEVRLDSGVSLMEKIIKE